MAATPIDRKMNKGARKGKPRMDSTPEKDEAGTPVPNDAPNPEDRVYRTLYESILDHRLAPGTKLKEVPLAEVFGVTRSVIRKALTRLSAVKLVTLRPQHGAAVANPSNEEVTHIFAARRLVETAVIDALIGTITAQQIRELRSLMKREKESYRTGDMTCGIRLSMDFHTRLAAYAGNTVLAEFLQQLVIRTPLIFLTQGSPGHSTSCSDREHQEIIDAIIAGDRARAIAFMEEHLRHLEHHVQHQREAVNKRSGLASLLGLDVPGD